MCLPFLVPHSGYEKSFGHGSVLDIEVSTFPLILGKGDIYD